MIGLECELNLKEDLICQLKVDIENERQVTAHVQFTQERDLMLKEKEIAALNTILTQERKLLLDKEEEIKTLRAGSVEMESYNNGTIDNKRIKSSELSEPPTPTRPP